jgi:hypothetical protein
VLTHQTSEQTTFAALPFSANDSDVNVDLAISFLPAFQIEFSLLVGAATGSAGFFFNIPEVDIDVRQLKSSAVDASCNPASNALDSAFQSVFPNLTNVASTFGLSLGFSEDVNVVGETLNNLTFGTTVLFQHNYPGPTACLAYDAAAKTYLPAASAAAAVTNGTKFGNSAPSGSQGVLDLGTAINLVVAVAVAVLMIWL